MATRHTPVRQLLYESPKYNQTGNFLLPHDNNCKNNPPHSLQRHTFADPDALLDDKTETLLFLRLNRLEERVKISANTPDWLDGCRAPFARVTGAPLHA